MANETLPQSKTRASKEGDAENLESCSSASSERLSGVDTCRVCQCIESDKRGDTALEFLGIEPPLQLCNKNGDSEDAEKKKNNGRESRYTELVSPDGEVLVCEDELEDDRGTVLIELGCSCKNDIALVHYGCALKWFVNHGSTVCEICGHMATSIRTSDFKKVICALKEYEALRERTASGDPNPAQVRASNGVDPDAVAAIRRQRLSEISLWFGLPSNHNNNNNNNHAAVSLTVSEQSMNTVVTEEAAPSVNPTAKWAFECTGILVATGLLTVTLAWLIAPQVGKKTARSGLHFLLGGVCALTVVVFFRFFVLTRIKYGQARYWAILLIFWFLVFGIWASRTHGVHSK